MIVRNARWKTGWMPDRIVDGRENAEALYLNLFHDLLCSDR
jgi:hypothetical protein